MANTKTQINTSIELPLSGFGRSSFHIYSDPDQDAKAKKLIKDLPKILFDAYKLGCDRFSKRIKDAAIKCIDTQIPPKGTTWPALSKSYIEKKGDNLIYIYGYQYRNSIGIHKENVYYTTGAFYKTSYYVGLPRGVQKQSGKGQRKYKEITLIQVANILERGSNGKIPKRELWGPLYRSGGTNTGKEALERTVKKAIQDLIRNGKYL